MNTEVISSRYAKAFLSYVTEKGSGDKVYSQVCDIVQNMRQVPQLREVILRKGDVPLEKKIEILSMSLNVPVADDITDFMALVRTHRRMELFESMLWSFISRYREANHIKVGSLVTAVPEDDLRQRLESIYGSRTSCEVHFDESVNPDLIGGFIFELDGYRLDASVRARLEQIRRKLVDDSSRIV